MKIVVTGHRGYIGTVLADHLLERGHEVIGIDAAYFPKNLKATTLGSQEALHEVLKDIRNIDAEDVDRAEAVVHLAGLSNDPLGELNADWTMQVNHLATVHLAELSKRNGVRRFIFISTCSVYGANEGGNLNEEAQTAPLTAYAKSKLNAERDLLSLADKSFAPVIVRSATAYGVSPCMRLDLVVNNLAACAHSSGTIRLLSDGTAWRPLIHIRDIALAVEKCLNAPLDEIRGETFNLGGNSENYTVRDVARFVKEAFPSSILEFDSKRGKDARSYRVDFAKIHERLKFTPAWNVRKGIEEIRDALGREMFGPEEFQDARFYRVAYLKDLVERGLLDENLHWRKTTAN